MNFKDLKENFFASLKKGAAQNQPEDDGVQQSNMSNGGFSGYHPNQPKKSFFGTQSMKSVQPQNQGTTRNSGSGMTNAFNPVAGMPYNAPPMTPYPAQQQTYADPARQYTAGLGGFGGGFTQQQANPFAQQPMGATQQQANPFAQQPMGATQQQANPFGQPPMGTTQQPPVNPYQPPMGQPQGNPYQQQPQDMQQMFDTLFGTRTSRMGQQPQANPTMQQPPVQNPWPPQPQPQQPQQRTGFTERLRGLRKDQPKQEPGNIAYIDPNNFVGTDGKAYRHVERVAQLVSVSACFRIIEFMRNGESVIVNTESIANEADVQRCLDMLAGAAFTLGCSLTKITQLKRAYLIAPATVLVMQDTGVARWNDNDQASRGSTVPEESYPGQFRPERGVYAPDRPYEAEPAMTYPQTAPAYAEPAPAPYQHTARQQTMRQHTTRTQPREAYNSDTRRGFYGTAAGSNLGGFGQ